MSARMVRALYGSSVTVHVLSASEVPDDQEQAVLNSVPFAVFTHYIFPLACHDWISVDEHGGPLVQFCHDTNVLNLPPNTTCRLLPQILPFSPPVTLLSLP